MDVRSSGGKKRRLDGKFHAEIRKSQMAVRGDAKHGCQMAIARFLESYVFGPSGFWTMAFLRYAAKFDPFLSLDCAPHPPPWSNPRKRRDQILQRSGAIVLQG